MDKNKKYFITIAEPWNFKSLDGNNIIKGIILSIVNEMCLVFKADYSINFGDAVGDFLILSPRIKNNNFDHIEEVEVNGGLLLIDYRPELSENELKKNSKFVIIGSINSET